MAMTELVQLASTWIGDDPPAAAQLEPKIDGWRAVWMRGLDGEPHLYTGRGGGRINGVEHIEHRCKLMEQAAGKPLVLDGEFQVDGTLAATKKWCESGWKQGGEAGEFFMFDILNAYDWGHGGGFMPQQDRSLRLGELLASAERLLDDEWEWRPGSFGADHKTRPLRVLPRKLVFSAQEVVDEVLTLWSMGAEGAVVKDIVAPYQRKRTKNWQKVTREGRKWMDLWGIEYPLPVTSNN